MKKIVIALLTSSLLMACVSKKIHHELEDSYGELKKEYQYLSDSFEDLQTNKNSLDSSLATLNNSYNTAVLERDSLQRNLKTTANNLATLKNAYKALETNSSAEIASNSENNRRLLALLETKENALSTESERLQQLQNALERRSARVTELENLIATKDANMKRLKNAISAALTNFEGKGLTVEQRNGKVYISMENKLLFSSGSWSVGREGRKAVEQLANVLAENSDIAVLIEGHTDNVPYGGNGALTSNWDLSTKRATAIVAILSENPAIHLENVTAAGRGEFAPIATNKTTEGKRKNRRIEVILTPKLDKISKLLNDI